MTTDNPFRSGGIFNDLFKKQREQAEMFKRLLGPGYELQQRMKAFEGPLAGYRNLQQSGALRHIESLQNRGFPGSLRSASTLHAASIAALQARSTSSWMLALQNTAIGIAQHDLGTIKTQRLLAASAGADVLQLVKSFDANRSIIEKMINASKWTEQFRLLSERIAPGLAGLKLAAEQARLLDMQILRATAEVAAKSAVVIVAEQVLEAHDLIVAIGQADSHTHSLSLFARLLSLIETIFAGFQENTVKELKGVGAFRLIELLMMAFAIWHLVVPTEMSPAEQAAFTDVNGKIEVVERKLDEIVSASEAADESYVADLPRAELKRDAAIRREPKGKASVLMTGVKGTPLAVKECRRRWRLVVYRDPLTDQLSEGWVYAPVLQMLDNLTS